MERTKKKAPVHINVKGDYVWDPGGDYVWDPGVHMNTVVIDDFKNPHRILVNDPSMTAWGWAVISYAGEIIKTGCIKTVTEGKKRRIRKSDEDTQRYSEIIHTLLDAIRQYNVNYIVSELQHGSQNASGAKSQGAVTALLQAISDTLEIGIEWYSEGDSKKALLGKTSATKQETIDAIKKLYIVPWDNVKYKDEAVADAISIYHCAKKHSSTLKLLKR